MSAAVCERKAIYRTNICPVRSVVPCMVYIRMGVEEEERLLLKHGELPFIVSNPKPTEHLVPWLPGSVEWLHRELCTGDESKALTRQTE